MSLKKKNFLREQFCYSVGNNFIIEITAMDIFFKDGNELVINLLKYSQKIQIFGAKIESFITSLSLSLLDEIILTPKTREKINT